MFRTTIKFLFLFIVPVFFFFDHIAFCLEITVEAENMDKSNCNGCTDIDGGIHLSSAGSIQQSIDFGVGGNTIFTVTARGEIGNNDWPIMSIVIDGEKIGSISVQGADWESYALSGSVSEGEHIVAISFDNDFYNPDNNDDRNLDIDSLKINIDDAPLDPLDKSRIQVSWTYDDGGSQPDGFRIFLRYDGKSFDYGKPEPTENFPDGNIIGKNSAIISAIAKRGEKTIIYLVVRAYQGQIESPDSEEVSTTIDKTSAIVLNPPTNVQLLIMEQ